LVHEPWNPAKPHDLQVSVQSDSQQTPSAQNPLVHWFVPAQTWPFALLGMQTAALQ
jgi:hypothetical protein